jgi:pyruvate formate lyase activating enzyme
LTVWGREYTVAEAMALIRRDRIFFEKTGGGVTVSGGEALLQPAFVLALLRQCKDEGINTCLETALCVAPELLEDFFACTDLFITDIKTMDAEAHRARCGVSNTQILKNISLIAERGAKLVIRTPVLKGFNATDEDMEAIGCFIRDELHGRVLQHQLLPYRQLGTEKYRSLDRDYPMEGFEGYEREEWEADIRRFITLLRAMGVNAVSGSSTKL